MLNRTPWYRSLAMWGILLVLVAGSGFTTLRVAVAIAAVGVALVLLDLRLVIAGLRVVTPNRGDRTQWEVTFDAEGMNPYGETAHEVYSREYTMDRVARLRRKQLLGAHHSEEDARQDNAEGTGALVPGRRQ